MTRRQSRSNIYCNYLEAQQRFWLLIYWKVSCCSFKGLDLLLESRHTYSTGTNISYCNYCDCSSGGPDLRLSLSIGIDIERCGSRSGGANQDLYAEIGSIRRHEPENAVPHVEFSMAKAAILKRTRGLVFRLNMGCSMLLWNRSLLQQCMLKLCINCTTFVRV